MKIQNPKSKIQNRITAHVHEAGFTLVEVIVASIMVVFAVAGIWGVYWSVVNTYYVEQKGANLQSEGERILDLIQNGGYFGGKRIYGLSAMSGVSGSGYPVVGTATIPGVFTDADDYRVGYPLDSGVTNMRYAQFYVQFVSGPTSKLYYELKTDGTTGDEHNYNVLITQNMLQRKTGTDVAAFGSYDKTWFKAEQLSSVSGFCQGVKVSFYLADTALPLVYNYRLDRKADPPIASPEQSMAFMNGIPYPKYFSTTVYFTSRE